MSDSPYTTTVPRADSRPLTRLPPAARLRIVHPSALAGAHSLAAPLLTLGRESGAHLLKIDHPTVSRRHFSIEWDPLGDVHVSKDLGSRNGSWVDGVAATTRIALRDGALVRVADVFLVYERGRGVETTDPEDVSREAIPGDAATMRLLRADVHRVASDPSPVLLLGETGTGKEWITREIHRLSGRAGALVPVNCAALSPQLVESQLFGHLRGAFTGAGEAQPGLFRSAERGTLFLDEIGELPLELQPKLLRVIQEGEVYPVGSARSVRVDVRVVAATHRDLDAATRAGRFREDLHARLSLWQVRVPPLRERRADVLAWIERLGRLHAARRSGVATPPLDFEPDAVNALLLASWPTNLRGLDRLVHELTTNAGGGAPIAVSRLPAWLAQRAEEPPAPAGESVARQPPPSREEFTQVFLRLKRSVRAVARHFDRDRRQIYRWMESYGLKEK